MLLATERIPLQSGTEFHVSRWAWNFIIARLPLFAFFAVYLFTCYIGMLALIFSDKFHVLYLYFSGAHPPDLTRGELVIALLLLHAGPLVMWLGFELGLWSTGRWFSGRLRIRDAADGARVIGVLFFFASVCLACWSLYRAGGLENFGGWLDYNAYVYGRWRLFDHLTFFEFVNLYTLLPLLAGYVILNARRWLTAGLTGSLVALLQYPLANRKALLTSAILIAAALYIHFYVGKEPRRSAAARWHLNLGVWVPAVLWGLYVFLTLLSVISESAQPFHSITDRVPPAEPRPRLADEQIALRLAVDDLGEARAILTDRRRAVIIYTLFAPLTRTSVTALVYPAIFPRWHPYYHVDLGMDIVRIGRMPDDNLVVYRILWPGHHRGSVAAPFHFVLYSQGGMLVAVIGALVMGFLTGCCWTQVVDQTRLGAEMSLFGGLLVTFGVFLAIDSIRNSTVVSYGLVWGALLLLLLHLSHWLPQQLKARSLAG